MKRLFICRLLIFLSIVGWVRGSLVKARANIDALNELRNVVIDHFIPSLSRFIDEAELSSPETEVEIFDNQFGRYVGLIALNGLRLGSLRDSSQVQFDAYFTQSGQSEIILGIGDVSAIVKALDLALRFTPPGQSTVDCGVRQSLTNTSASIESLSFRFSTSFSDGNLTVIPQEARLENFKIDINVAFDISSCQLGDTELPTIFETFANTASNLLQPLLIEEFSLFLRRYIAIVPFNEPRQVDVGGLDGLGGSTLQITPDVTKFTIDATNTSFDVAGDTVLQASLSSPQWRANRSYKPELDGRILATPPNNRLINFSLGLDSLNNIIETAWYLVWSTIAQEETETSLCDPTPTDECPIPPLRTSAGFGQIFGLDAFLLRLVFIIDGLFFTDFEYQVVVPTPVITVDEDDSVSLEAGAQARIVGQRLIFGRSDLMAIDAKIRLDASVPRYDSTRGGLTGLELTNLQVSDINFGFLGITRIFGWLFTLPINFIAPNLINFVISNLGVINLDFLSLVNEAIEMQLSQVRLMLPTIPFPQAGLNITASLLDVSLKSRPEPSSDETAYLEAGGNIGFTFLEYPPVL